MKLQDLLAKLRDPSITYIEIYETECYDKEYLVYLQEIQDACAANTSLQSIIINPSRRAGYFSDFTVSSQVVCALMSLLKSDKLQSFKLRHHFLPWNPHAKKILINNLAGNKTLKELEISGCEVSAFVKELVPVISKMQLTTLNLSENKISDHESLLGLFRDDALVTRMYSTGAGLKSTLVSLDLDNNYISDLGLSEILLFLLKQTDIKLQKFYLIHNNHDPQGIDDLRDRVDSVWNPSRSTTVHGLWGHLANKLQLANSTIVATGMLPDEFDLRQEIKSIYDGLRHRPTSKLGWAYLTAVDIYDRADAATKLKLDLAGDGPKNHYGYAKLKIEHRIAEIEALIKNLESSMYNALFEKRQSILQQKQDLNDEMSQLKNSLSEIKYRGSISHDCEISRGRLPCPPC